MQTVWDQFEKACQDFWNPPEPSEALTNMLIDGGKGKGNVIKIKTESVED